MPALSYSDTCLGGRLEDDCVSGHEGRSNLADSQVDWIVEGRHCQHHSEWHLHARQHPLKHYASLFRPRDSNVPCASLGCMNVLLRAHLGGKAKLGSVLSREGVACQQLALPCAASATSGCSRRPLPLS